MLEQVAAASLAGLLPGGFATSPLAVCGLLLAFAGIAGVHATGCWRLRNERRRRARLQRRMDEVSGTLPVVVFQARRTRDGQIHLDWLAGDTPQLFSANATELQEHPGRMLAAIPAAEHARVLSALVRSVRRLCPVSLRFSARGVRGLRHVAMHAWPSVQAGNEQRWSGYWMDISDTQLREQAILAAHARATADAGERLQRVATLGEGIGAPMQALLYRLTRLREGPLDQHQRVALAALEDAASMLSRILGDVVEQAAGNEPGMALHATRVDLRGLLASMETLLRPVALVKGLDLQHQVEAGVADVLLADETRLRQILFNLVGNAIKFTVQGGVSLLIRRLDETAQGQRLRIDIADTGVGIAVEQQEAVFEPFAQAVSTVPADPGGTGLGLGICRQLVRAMGGRLSLCSTPGKGTVVSVELELPRPAAPSMVPTADPPSSCRGASAGAGCPRQAGLALVAEDHPTQQLLMQWWLRGMGLEVEVANDGAEALASWRRLRPRLLFTDDRMPGRSGAELVQCIRQEEQARGDPRVPIIGMSADPDAMRGLGLDYLLTKPITRRALSEAIERVAPGLLSCPSARAVDTGSDADADMPSMATLVARFGGGQIVRELVHTLRVSLEEDLDALQQEWDSGADPSATQRLHRMAGGVGSVGLVALATHLRELNEAAAPMDAAQRTALRARLQRSIAHLRALET